MRLSLGGRVVGGAWAQKLAITFVLWSTLWLVTSDFALAWLRGFHPGPWKMQTEKGLIYVLISGLMLWSALRRIQRDEETARRESEQRLRSLRDSGLIGVVGISADGKIVDANWVFGEMVGRQPNALLERPIDALFASSFQAERKRAQGDFASHGRTGLFRCDLLHDDEHLVPVITGRARIGPEDASIAYFLDISPLLKSEEQRLKLQEQLLQSEKMNALGQFASGIAHNFNNELSIIMGYGAVLSENLAGNARSAAQLQKILDSAERSRKLIQQLLTFSKRQPMHPEVIDANQLLRDLQPSLRRILDPGVDVRLELSPAPQWLRADASQLVQAILHLASNARDAMPKGGTLLLAAYPELHKGAAKVTLEVSDDGAGMADDVAQHIFEPFFTTKVDSGGTGLGLPTVYGIVQQNGGEVEVVSRLNIGTTFKMRFPVHNPVAAVSPPELRPARGLHGNILLVEDRDDVRELMSQVLASTGLLVIPARDGLEAIALADANPIDLVLSDVVMPKMNGPEAVRVIRSRHPEIKVIYVSGSADLVEPNGRDVVMWKPVKPEALLTTVRSCLTASGEFNSCAA